MGVLSEWCRESGLISTRETLSPEPILNANQSGTTWLTKILIEEGRIETRMTYGSEGRKPMQCPQFKGSGASPIPEVGQRRQIRDALSGTCRVVEVALRGVVLTSTARRKGSLLSSLPRPRRQADGWWQAG